MVGSRRFPDLVRVEAYVRALPADSSLVTGGASGVDAATTRVARERGLPVRVIPASFDEQKDAAAAEARNLRLIEQCDLLVAFWDGESAGTRMTIDRALDAGKEVHVLVARPGPE